MIQDKVKDLGRQNAHNPSRYSSRAWPALGELIAGDPVHDLAEHLTAGHERLQVG